MNTLSIVLMKKIRGAHMNSRGSLSLSVNAIVVMVIAFVVLGLILTFTRQIFTFGTTKTAEIFDTTNLDSEPTAGNTITLPDTIVLTKGSEKTIRVGYYNKNPLPATDAQFKFTECLDGTGEPVDVNTLPSVRSPAVTVGASQSKGYKIIMKDDTTEGLPGGVTYICTVSIGKKDSDFLGTNLYDTKQIFLEIGA
jgi:hypothetical protein